jgi:hypothetical protein
MSKSLGKIRSAEFGWGGYQEVQFGVTVYLDTPDGSVCDFWGPWGTEVSRGAKWTHESRLKILGETAWRLRDILQAAGKHYVSQLAGVPVEVTWNGQQLLSWRVLKEVL